MWLGGTFAGIDNWSHLWCHLLFFFQPLHRFHPSAWPTWSVIWRIQGACSVYSYLVILLGYSYTYLYWGRLEIKTAYLTFLGMSFQASATFGWTGSMFGCDWVPTPGTKIPIGGFFMIINNFIFILVFYGIVIIHLCKQKHEVTRKS